VSKTWYSEILPYIEEDTGATSSAGTALGFSVCPSYPQATAVAATYAGNVGTAESADNGGMKFAADAKGNGLGTSDFKLKGLSKVAMIGERSTGVSNWSTGVVHVTNSGSGFSSQHTGSLIGICKADGSVEFVTGTEGTVGMFSRITAGI
jgi:hypothetical protein